MDDQSKKMEEVSLPSGWRVIGAKADCPVCGETIIVQPMHGTLVPCSNCRELLAVLVAPLIIDDDARTACAFQLRARDGRWSWLFNPMFFDFGEW